jgi:hypothetical protein
MDEAFDAELATFGKVPRTTCCAGCSASCRAFDYPFARRTAPTSVATTTAMKRHGEHRLWATIRRPIGGIFR